jgi:hypothetical protein
MIAFAVMLFAAASAGWAIAAGLRGGARAYARFAFALYAALAVAIGIDARLANSVVLIVSAVAPLLFVLALKDAARRPLATALASLALAAGCMAGMAAAVTGIAALAFGPLLLSVIATIAVALRDWRERPVATVQAAVAAAALLAGASSFVAGGTAALAALCAFTSAGLLGAALSLTQRSNGGVEEERVRDLRSMRAVHNPR